jgi:hypothetical protein
MDTKYLSANKRLTKMTEALPLDPELNLPINGETFLSRDRLFPGENA